MTGSGRIDLADLLAAHRELMRDDADERRYAGVLRDVRTGSGSHCLTHATPSISHRHPPMSRCICATSLRTPIATTMPVLAQCAISHAQFGRFTPSPDGSGRIGRALINSILRRRKVTTSVVVPLASALVAHRDRYFGRSLPTGKGSGAADAVLLDKVHISLRLSPARRRASWPASPADGVR